MLWPVMADPSQLEAALVNFALNARDAMPKGGRLDITTSNAVLDAGYAALHPEVTPGAYVVLSRSATPATGHRAGDRQGRIFEPFFTTKARARAPASACRWSFGFVKQSGGHMTVYSELGLGTTFRIYLPAQRGVEASPPMRPMGTGVPSAATRRCWWWRTTRNFVRPRCGN